MPFNKETKPTLNFVMSAIPTKLSRRSSWLQFQRKTQENNYPDHLKSEIFSKERFNLKKIWLQKQKKKKKKKKKELSI